MFSIFDYSGRFGNIILYYTNLVQVSKYLNEEFDAMNHPDLDLLGVKNNLKQIESLKFETVDLRELLPQGIESLKVLSGRNIKLKNVLSNFFFLFDFPTRQIFNITPLQRLDNKIHIGIHFRGTDFFAWNKLSILSPDYYIKAIDLTVNDNVRYYIFSDDKNLISYKTVIRYLQDKGADFQLGDSTAKGTHYINDFKQLADCDIIISSPSTFSICAGFMGREKEIIHDSTWVNSRLEKNDGFWEGVNSGGNHNYKIKTII